MLSRKNLFQYFAISVFVLSLIYILAGGILSLGEGQEYPYLQSGVLLALMLLGWLLLNGGSGLIARIDPGRRLRDFPWTRGAETAFALLILIAAALLRIRVVQTMPMRPESDYRTYYEVAGLLARGALRTEGPGYCDYIALFPHVYGYPFALSLVFRIFGTSVEAALYFNVALSLLTVFLCWRTARLAGGRLCGAAALLLTALWPSQILYINMVASEYLFSFMLMFAMYLFVLSIRECGADARHPAAGVLLHVFLGGWLALTAAVRPMALLLIITIVICLLFERLRLPPRRTEDQPVSLVFLSRGWMRCFLVIAVYLGAGALISAGITNAVDRDLASGTTSFGYNLLVGLNVESEGGWNPEDADYLYAALDATGSASEAHLACRDLAIQRLRDVKGILNLFLRKFQELWMNDDYASTWNLLFMKQQGTLTASRESFLYAARGAGNIFYLLALSLAAMEGIYLWRRGAGLAYPFLLMFLGTAAMHLFVESQNRYHFHALYMLAMLAAFGARDICGESRARVLERLKERRSLAQQKQEDAMKKEALLREEQHLAELRRQAMQSRFDLRDALEKGYVTVRVSGAYADKAEADDSAPDDR